MSVAHVAVVVPARDEGARLGGCLASVAAARAVLQDRRPTLVVDVVVVLDRCTDRSAEIARSAGATCVVVDVGSVGAARRAGVARAAALGADSSTEQVWISTTDADTTVPTGWLVDHVQLADLGHDLVVGAVHPEPDELSPAGLHAWRSRHAGPDVHVHGANLGVRLTAYLEAGGFPEVREHEDVALFEAVLRTGRPWVTGTRVTTSARLRGRTPGGFAGYLRALTRESDGRTAGSPVVELEPH
ncbi:glycosyltransferase family 2 protein [Nocardioides hankookensis]|uniref:4,4'-diaponeurosporenoate glycosyltransferase n=1 Tax=Nocardioides hankookensis TaxID=443157 RepID=A0ABW1LHW3_9ACTN